MSLNAPYTPNTTIQSTQVSNDLTGLANGSNDTATNSMSTFRSENLFDFVASGCVWSGDAYASTRNASQTSGVVYISGIRLVVASVSARNFTASKDTYIDINGSGVQVYTEVTNNAASPALTAGNLRIGIIVTGVSTIAAAGSVNQGQEGIVLPIASSIPYAVTDSLGNLICSRDPTHQVLGQQQLIVSQTITSGATTDLTGMAVTFIAPANRKIIARLFIAQVTTAAAAGSGQTFYIKESTTILNQGQFVSGGVNFSWLQVMEYEITPSAGLHTYKGTATAGGGNLTINGAAANVCYLRIELR